LSGLWISLSITATGTGLDKLLGGGIPMGRVVLVLGEPGSGKTTLCAQFLANGFMKFNENGVYISLEEGREQFFREMLKFGLDFAAAEKDEKFAFVNASPRQHILSFKTAAFFDYEFPISPAAETRPAYSQATEF
jgi:circadian clock protein KaiC